MNVALFLEARSMELERFLGVLFKKPICTTTQDSRNGLKPSSAGRKILRRAASRNIKPMLKADTGKYILKGRSRKLFITKKARGLKRQLRRKRLQMLTRRSMSSVVRRRLKRRVSLQQGLSRLPVRRICVPCSEVSSTKTRHIYLPSQNTKLWLPSHKYLSTRFLYNTEVKCAISPLANPSVGEESDLFWTVNCKVPEQCVMKQLHRACRTLQRTDRCTVCDLSHFFIIKVSAKSSAAFVVPEFLTASLGLEAGDIEALHHPCRSVPFVTYCSEDKHSCCPKVDTDDFSFDPQCQGTQRIVSGIVSRVSSQREGIDANAFVILVANVNLGSRVLQKLTNAAKTSGGASSYNIGVLGIPVANKGCGSAAALFELQGIGAQDTAKRLVKYWKTARLSCLHKGVHHGTKSTVPSSPSSIDTDIALDVIQGSVLRNETPSQRVLILLHGSTNFDPTKLSSGASPFSPVGPLIPRLPQVGTPQGQIARGGVRLSQLATPKSSSLTVQTPNSKKAASRRTLEHSRVLQGENPFPKTFAKCSRALYRHVVVNLGSIPIGVVERATIRNQLCLPSSFHHEFDTSIHPFASSFTANEVRSGDKGFVSLRFASKGCTIHKMCGAAVLKLHPDRRTYTRVGTILALQQSMLDGERVALAACFESVEAAPTSYHLPPLVVSCDVGGVAVSAQQLGLDFATVNQPSCAVVAKVEKISVDDVVAM